MPSPCRWSRKWQPIIKRNNALRSNEQKNEYPRNQKEDQGKGDKQGNKHPQVRGLMNLPKAYDLNDKKPKAPYQSSNKGHHPQNLGGLRIGYNPESGLEAVFSPTYDKQQQMQNAAGGENDHGHKKGGNDHETYKYEIHSKLANHAIGHGKEAAPHHQKLPEKSKHCPDGAKKESKNEGLSDSSFMGHFAEKIFRGKENGLEGLINALPDPQFRTVLPGRSLLRTFTLRCTSSLFPFNIKGRGLNSKLKPVFATGAGGPSDTNRDFFFWYPL